MAGSKFDRGSRCLGMSDICWGADGLIFRVRNARTIRRKLGQEVHLHFADSPPCPCVTLLEFLDRSVSQQCY